MQENRVKSATETEILSMPIEVLISESEKIKYSDAEKFTSLKKWSILKRLQKTRGLVGELAISADCSVSNVRKVIKGHYNNYRVIKALNDYFIQVLHIQEPAKVSE